MKIHGRVVIPDHRATIRVRVVEADGCLADSNYDSLGGLLRAIASGEIAIAYATRAKYVIPCPWTLHPVTTYIGGVRVQRVESMLEFNVQKDSADPITALLRAIVLWQRANPNMTWWPTHVLERIPLGRLNVRTARTPKWRAPRKVRGPMPAYKPSAVRWPKQPDATAA